MERVSDRTDGGDEYVKEYAKLFHALLMRDYWRYWRDIVQESEERRRSKLKSQSKQSVSRRRTDAQTNV